MRVIILISGFIIPLSLFAQESQEDASLLRIWEAGLPYITNYTSEDYKAHVQNWCFIQDDNGIMYVGNTSGILEFDGVSWRLIKLSNNSLVRSFAKDWQGRIYVGGVRDFGYLQPDTTGQIQFQSLLPELETDYQDFADIWNTFVHDDNVYFISDDYIFKWDGKRIEVWEPEKRFGNASLINDHIFIESDGVGILKFVDDTLELVPDGDRINNIGGRIRTILPYPGDKMLLVHSLGGLFLYDHHEIRPFNHVSINFLKDKIIYDAAILPNGDYLFITLGNGVIILKPDGSIKQRFSKERGLVSDVIFGAFIDREGTVWLGTDSGISKIDLSSPVRRFSQTDGLGVRVESLSYHLNRLYVGTSNGLFYLSKQFSDLGNNGALFQKISETQRRIRSLIQVGDNLLVIAHDNIYRVDINHQLHPVEWEGGAAVSALRSKLDSTRVYVGSLEGQLSVIDVTRWRVTPKLKIEGEIHSIHENPDGSLWLSTQYNGIYKANLTASPTSEYAITSYDTTAGLPDMSFNYIYPFKDKTYITTYDSIFYFDETDQTFKPDTLLLGQFDSDVNAYGYMLADEVGNIWQAVKAGFENRIYHIRNSRLKELNYSRRFSDFETFTIYKMEELLLFIGPKGIILYNLSLEKTPPELPAVIIRNVLIQSDSLIFAGYKGGKDRSTTTLPFKDRALRFEYALPSYDKPESNQYQYYLEGFDEEWSGWTTETQRDFTNLPEGDYLFRVRGQNVYGQISEEAAFAFTILPPWYRTWWAYLFYGLVLLGLVGFIVRLRSEQLRREKKALENIVQERTDEIRQKNEQLKHQAQQLQEMDHQKSRFFANISHEFRTPLTLIKGPVENIKEHPEETLSLEHIEMIDRNTDRLLRLVNQLLDLSKLDAETLHLEFAPGDIYQFLRVLAASFSSHAEQREIQFHIRIQDQPRPALFDHDKLENIVYNLLSNAFKFTPDKGEVTLVTSMYDNILKIEVSDTGKGIPSDRLDLIFDRFYQVDDTRTREQEGTGIGLSLTKELVSFMGGTITVNSKPGKGSTFTIQLPLELTEVSDRDVPEYETTSVYPLNDETKEKERADSSLRDPVKKEDTFMTLVVEDNADMRQFIREQLDVDYHIVEAADGEEGWETAVSEVPDLVITDLMMPKMDGMELCRKLKTDERTSHIPVIMLTAKSGQEHKIKGLETGADSYLTKPFDRQELQVRVKNLITQRRKLREKYSKTVLLEPRDIAVPSLDERFLQKVKNLLEENHSAAGFGVSQMQDALTMSKTQLHRKMKALTGHPPGEFLRNYRLKRAARILKQQGDSVTQVAYAVGFNNLSYFSKCFKELYEVTPSEYKDSASF